MTARTAQCLGRPWKNLQNGATTGALYDVETTDRWPFQEYLFAVAYSQSRNPCLSHRRLHRLARYSTRIRFQPLDFLAIEHFSRYHHQTLAVCNHYYHSALCCYLDLSRRQTLMGMDMVFQCRVSLEVARLWVGFSVM